MVNWRNKIDSSIRNHLEAQINESYKHRKIYSLAKNPAQAQIWCAIANLSRQIFDLNLKLNYLEKALRDISESKKKR